MGLKNIFGGGRGGAPAAPSLPAPPPIPELMDIIDEVSGVQTITVTGADGKKRRHTQRLPLTPQEQKILSEAENLITQSVNNIQTLYKYDPDSVLNYQPFIQAFAGINGERMKDLAQIGNFKDIAEKVEQFKNINKDLSIKEFNNRERMIEENLAHRGLSRSTEASEMRAAMAKERALLEQQLDVNAENYGEDLQSRRLEREGRLYALREDERQARLQEAEANYNLERQKRDDLDRVRENAINENLNLLNVGQNIKGIDANKSNLGLANNQNAISLFNSQAAASNQRYANDINRIQTQYGMDLGRYNSTPASLGRRITDTALSLGGRAAGRYIGNKIDNATGFGR